MPKINPILAEINRKANKRHHLYLELGHNFSLLAVEEIKVLNQELTQLWQNRRAEGKIWMPRLREGSRNRNEYERQLRPGAHGYR